MSDFSSFRSVEKREIKTVIGTVGGISFSVVEMMSSFYYSHSSRQSSFMNLRSMNGRSTLKFQKKFL